MNLRPLLILPPLAIGVAGFLWMTQETETTAQPEPQARLAVRVMTVTGEPVTVTATGYGRVEAMRTWTAVSEVDGRIIDMVAGLAEGSIVDEGDVLVAVDRTDYELSIQKSKANIAAAEASLTELDRQEANSERSLEIEERSLLVAQAEFQRVTDLVARGAGTQASLDTAQRSLLGQETAVTNLQNTLALYPAQRASMEATLAVRKAELAEAERSLENTTIHAPFRGRVSEASAEVGQFIRTGEQLLSIEAMDAVEIVAAFQPNAFLPLVQTTLGRTLQQVSEVDASRVTEFLSQAGVTAVVRMDFGSFVAEYPADLVRFRGAIDNETGTLGLAVRVADPFVAGGATGRPPLNVGSFVSVVLQSDPVSNLITIPRAVVQQGDDGDAFVYLADKEDTLTVAPIRLGASIGDKAIVLDGVAVEDRVILSAPRPPIVGMPLEPIDAGEDA